MARSMGVSKTVKAKKAIQFSFSKVIFLGSLLLVFLFLLASPLSLQGQSGQGSISGRVTDIQEALVPKASVTVLNTETGTTVTTNTNDSGFYSVPSLNPGNYSITVARRGFETTVVRNVIVSAASQTTIPVILQVGHENTEVTVTAQEALLTKDTSDVVTTVDHEIVQELPYPERSALEATLLVPGVNGDPLQPGGIATENPGAYMSTVTPGATLSIGGGAPGTSSIYVDGSDVTQASFPRAGINLSGRIVQETTTIVTGLSAKYGRTSSGVIVQTSTPGKNAYHGGLTWRHNDPYFNAYPLGGTAPSNNHENYYGAYVGGPVWIPKIYNGRKKTFFFVGIEPARLRTSFTFRGTLLTPDELAGKLNNSLPLLDQTILKNQGAAAAIAAPRIGGIYYQSPNNAQGFPSGPIYGSPSQYRQIPGNDVSAMLAQNEFAKYVLSLMPSPTNPGPYVKFDRPDGLWQSDGTNGTYERGSKNIDNRYSIRIDHQRGTDRFFIRYTDVPLTNYRYYGVDQNNPLTMTPSDSAYSHDLAFGYTKVFSNSIVNNFHYSFLRVVQNRIPPPSTQAKDYAGSFGLTPAVLGKGFPTLGSFNTNGITYTIQPGPSNSNPTGIQKDQNFILGDDISWIKGRHSLQFGFDLRWIQSNQYDLSGLGGGKYSFTANMTGNGGSGGHSLASFILGNISSFTNTPVSVPGYYRWRYYAGYLQDDWSLTPKLTLNIGVRYELETPRMEKTNNQAILRTDQKGVLNGKATEAALCFANGCGGAKTLFPTNYWGIEPRIGFSYAPTSQTTVRGSYGILRLPLTGYENTPDPNLNVGSVAVGYQTGGVTPNNVVNYITNPVGPLTSALTALNGNRGPILYSLGLAPVYVEQTNAVPYTQTYSVTLQYQPWSKTLLQANYQGLKGTHLIGSFTQPINAPSIGTIIAAIQSKANLGGQSNNPYGIMQAGSIVKETNLQALNPYQNFFNQSVLEIYPRRGTSSYNGLFLSMNQRFGKGLSLLLNYTWQKSMDNVPQTNVGTSGGFGTAPPQNPFDMRNEWSVSSFDQPSRLKFGFTYKVPLGRNAFLGNHGRVINNLIGNIQVSGIGSISSGYPNYINLNTPGYFYSVTPTGMNGCSASGTSKYCVASALPVGYTLRPNIVPGKKLINPNWKKNPFGLYGSAATPYLNPDAFSTPGNPGNAALGIPPTPAFGNAPRTMTNARTPRETIFDAKISKGITFRERYQFNINATFNNAFNHPVYFALGNRSLDTITTSTVTGAITPSVLANFGTLNQSNTAGFSRIIRFGAEFTF